MARQGLPVVTFGDLTIYTSELVGFGYDQSWDISEHKTVSNQNLTQPGSLNAGQIQVRVTLRLDCAIVLAQVYGLHRNRSQNVLQALGIDYGLCYFSSLSFNVQTLDDLQAPLTADLDMTFTQANENY